MKLLSFIIFLLFKFSLYSQSVKFPEHLKKTHIAKMQNGDSLTYYQCHVDSASQEITTAGGQKIKSKKNRITLT